MLPTNTNPKPTHPQISPLLIISTLLLVTTSLFLLYPLLPAPFKTYNPKQTHPRIFHENPALEHFSSPSTTSTNENPKAKTWEDLLMPPSGGGLFATILDEKAFHALGFEHPYPPDPSQHENTVPESQTEGKKAFSYGISMLHQLHCLITLRGVIFPETSGKKGNESTSKAHLGDEEGDRVHWAHCFDYIAQGIICAADDTIERPKKIVQDDGRTIFHVDGVGAEHRCRDARRLWEVSVESLHNPVDMSNWEGEHGVREFFADKLSGYEGYVPGFYTLGTTTEGE